MPSVVLSGPLHPRSALCRVPKVLRFSSSRAPLGKVSHEQIRLTISDTDKAQQQSDVYRVELSYQSLT